MADLQLRRLERNALESGDLDLHAQLIRYRSRVGVIPEHHILYAAHLGDPAALRLRPDPRIIVECANCRSLRETRYRRNRDPILRPLAMEQPRSCLKCSGSEDVVLDRGLIKFVREVEDVPHRLLGAWAADCAERQAHFLAPRNAVAFHGRYRMPNQPERQPELTDTILPAVRQWLRNGEVDPLLYMRASVSTSPYTNVGAVVCLATIAASADAEGQERNVRFRAGEVASLAYHAAGGTRVERSWQENRLVRYLLGYLDPALIHKGDSNE